MPMLSSVIRVNASKQRVWDVVSDFGGVANWSPVVIKSSLLTAKDGREGARRQSKTIGFGTVQELVTEWDEELFRYVYQVEGGMGLIRSAHISFLVSSDDEGTLVTKTVHYQTRLGMLGALWDKLLLRRRLRRHIALTLAGLQHHVETGEVIGTVLPEVLRHLHRLSMVSGSNVPIWCLSASCQENSGNTVSGLGLRVDKRAGYDHVLR